MATHSSVLAWRIPGTGEPDGLLSMGSHRVRHDWSRSHRTFTEWESWGCRRPRSRAREDAHCRGTSGEWAAPALSPAVSHLNAVPQGSPGWHHVLHVAPRRAGMFRMLCLGTHLRWERQWVPTGSWCPLWELTHGRRPWCWERLQAGREGGDRGWDSWMASLTRWTWVWVNSRSWW